MTTPLAWRRRRPASSRQSSRLRSRTVLATSLNEEMTEHLGYEKHDPAGAGTGNIRDGTRPESVLTEASGQVRSTSRAIGRARLSRRS
jgi:transposase-like protein